MTIRPCLAVLILLAIVLASSPDAQATSGPGCYRVVNVAGWDVLNMRARPSAGAAVVDMLRPGSHGIIAAEGPCRRIGTSSRWCPVTHYDGDRVVSGWANARFLRDSDCP